MNVKNWWYGFKWRHCVGLLRLQRLILYFWPPACNWHKGDEPCTYDSNTEMWQAYCPDCGCMLDTKRCARCGYDFLDYESTGFDDVMAAPTVTDSGDLMCIRCASHYEEFDAGEPYDPYDDPYPEPNVGYDEIRPGL